MRTRFRLRTLFLLAALAAGSFSGQAAAQNGERSVSGSGRFFVFSENKDLRQKIAGESDEIRRVVLDELGLQTGASTPVVVTVDRKRTTQPGAPDADLNWIFTDAGPRVQLNLRVEDGQTPIDFRTQIVQAVLLAEKFRDKPPEPGKTYAEPPTWFVEGISEKERLRRSEPDASIYKGLMDLHEVPDLADFLATNPSKMTGAELSIFRAYGCALVNLLQNLPGGKRALLAFLKQAPADRADQIKLLFKTFPQVNASPSSLEKWWTLSLAKLSAADRYTAFTASETDRQLAKALAVTITDPATAQRQEYTLEQFPEFMKSKSRKTAMIGVNWELIRLSVRATPLFRPVLNEYREIVRSLERGKTRNVAQKLIDLAELRAQILRRVDEVADYLNWMEVTQLPAQSHEFDSYMRLSSQFDNPAAKRHTDPVGKYLDAVEYEIQ
ncbi:MAG TPA: hypothetical protein VIT91_15045 [Chthoniobacterales bacterium]